MDTLTIIRPDDWHIHLRDGDKLERTVNDAAAQFKRAIIMPNLATPITTVEAAKLYYERIMAVCHTKSFQPLMTLYLTDAMTVSIIKQATQTDFIKGVKLYPAGATTNSEFGITTLEKFDSVFAAMQKYDLPLLIHGEITDGDIFEREKMFIDTQLIPLRQKFPELRIVLEHITTADAVAYIKQQDTYTAATITAHHLLCDRNDLLVGGLKPDYYCLPILKTKQDQQALLAAATSGDPHFFLGTDSAPHSTERKYCASGCAGIYSAYSAIELYATAFEQTQALDKLEAFASFHGADFYRVPRNTETITLTKTTWQIPESLSFGSEKIIPFYAGKTLHWKLKP